MRNGWYVRYGEEEKKVANFETAVHVMEEQEVLAIPDAKIENWEAGHLMEVYCPKLRWEKVNETEEFLALKTVLESAAPDLDKQRIV